VQVRELLEDLPLVYMLFQDIGFRLHDCLLSLHQRSYQAFHHVNLVVWTSRKHFGLGWALAQESKKRPLWISSFSFTLQVAHFLTTYVTLYATQSPLTSSVIGLACRAKATWQAGGGMEHS
jgi:hypothetical protein